MNGHDEDAFMWAYSPEDDEYERRLEEDAAMEWNEMLALYGDTDGPDYDDEERRDVLTDCGIR